MGEISTRRQRADRILNVLLVGKSGHGKSSTGNSILGRKKFVALGGGGSVTAEYQAGKTTVNGREINVADIPGLCDTSCESKESKVDFVIEAITTGLGVFPEGFSAILLVLSYTVRITDEEREVIATLKSIMGEDVLRNHAICVFTHGDSFKNDFGDDEDTGYNFNTWCTAQEEYEDLLEECEGRCVLFDNMTRDEDEKRSQVADLISTIDNMKDRKRMYTMNNFKSAGKTREELKLELRLPLIAHEYSEKIESIREFARFGDTDLVDNKINHFEMLKTRVESLKLSLPKCQHKIVSRLRTELNELLMYIEGQEMMLAIQELEIEERKRVEEDIENERKQREIERREYEQQEEEHREKMRQLEVKQRELDEQREAENNHNNGDNGDDSGCVIL